MIVKNEGETSIECSVCGELVRLSAETRANPETKLLLMEQMGKEHAGCERYADQPFRPRRKRIFLVRHEMYG